MNKQMWKWMLAGTTSIMILGFFLSVWSINENHRLGTYTGLIVIGSICISWWCWVMFIIRNMIEHTDKTCKNLSEVKDKVREIRGLVKEYAEKTGTGVRERRKSPRTRSSPVDKK